MGGYGLHFNTITLATLLIPTHSKLPIFVRGNRIYVGVGMKWRTGVVFTSCNLLATYYWGKCERAPSSGVAGRNDTFVHTVRHTVVHLQLLLCMFLGHALLHQATVRPCLSKARDKERMAAETVDKRATALHHLRIATSLTLTPQYSTIT